MVDIHIVVPKEQQALARNGITPSEFDVLAVGNDEFLGVIEPTDSGYMFTDSFGHLTVFEAVADVTEVFKAVDDMFNPTSVH